MPAKTAAKPGNPTLRNEVEPLHVAQKTKATRTHKRESGAGNSDDGARLPEGIHLELAPMLAPDFKGLHQSGQVLARLRSSSRGLDLTVSKRTHGQVQRARPKHDRNAT